MGSYQNPILPGFYPDPSCILVDDTFVMINSSFQFFPGLPIHISKDLIHWEFIGNALCRPEQIPLDWAVTKVNRIETNEVFTSGLYAPTIRYHSGKFYIVCTVLTGTATMKASEDFQPRNFIIVSNNLKDPASFSDPIFFDFYGIDPSLFFDDDGKVYLQGSWIHGYRNKPATVIRQMEIDLDTGRTITPARDIWAGTGGKCPEGPHLYKKDGFYYLLIAEGGTHSSHMITMGRAKDPWGPYESFGGNPVLTAESKEAIIQCIGHGELFQDLQNQWWAVMLARREYGKSFPMGRETYLVPVEWPTNEFPSFERVQLDQICQRRLTAPSNNISKVDLSLSSPQRLFLRSPILENYQQEDLELLLKPSKELLTTPTGTMTFIGQRQTCLSSIASVILDTANTPVGQVCCGLTVYKDTFRHAAIEYDFQQRTLSLKQTTVRSKLETIASHSNINFTSLKLIIKSTVEKYTFMYCSGSDDSSIEVPLGEIDCATMSSDDFTGTIYAIYACGISEDVVRCQKFQVIDD